MTLPRALFLLLLIPGSFLISIPANAPANGQRSYPRAPTHDHTPGAYAYLLPASLAGMVEQLQRHGIGVDELREDVELDVEASQIDRRVPSLLTSFRAATSRLEARRIPAGTFFVRADQPRGGLVADLPKPRRLNTANLFTASYAESEDHPVLRLPAPVALHLGKVRPLPTNTPKKLITADMLDDGTLPDFDGDPATPIWLDDDHFLQTKAGQLLKVHAVSGRSVPYDGPVATVNEQAATTHGPQKGFRGGATPGDRELLTSNSAKTFNAFVRGNNLCIEEIATKRERPLTADGGELIRNGKSSWVYFEELYNRKWQAYWWSPDGSHIAFFRTDEAGMPKATVVDHTKVTQIVEVTAYPRAGEPNPSVKLGIVSVNGGEIRWVDLSHYDTKEPLLISAVGFLPDSKSVWLCVQDRIQTWLDFCVVGLDGGRPTKLFRDSTRAWIEAPARPSFLDDGSFLVTSERSGWKHLYHYDKTGKLLRPVTTGEWEVRTVQRVDEKEGWVYFSGTRDSHTASNAYRVKLAGGDPERITKGKGAHEVSFNPRGDMFIDTCSDPETPPQVRLHRADGTLIRVLDTNPVHERAEYQMAGYERVQIQTPDGFLLEASITKPANFDPKKKHPIWFTTYGGPQAPRIRDGFGGGKTPDQALTSQGYVVFVCDPRSASGKGAVSAWSAYRRLGIQELEDVEVAIRWLTAHPWADPKRVGMSGHSYGGFLTAFALTHSKLFAAGVAGAPVTDWHNYDTIYTERYMDTPQANPKGYEITSVVKAAANVHGRLLLTHGVKDDNVHVQNTLQLVHALQQANKDFDMMLYPTNRHGLGGVHYQRLTREFMKHHLRPGT